MRVPEILQHACQTDFGDRLAAFVQQKGLIPSVDVLASERFLARSVVPHVRSLSALFNRDEVEQSEGLGPYWGMGSHPANRRLAYLLYFMPSNLFRVASIWSELGRLGWRAPKVGPGGFRAVEFGAGGAAAVCGIALGEKHHSLGIPEEASWALIEQDRPMLEIGADWARTHFDSLGFSSWSVRQFHRQLDLGSAGRKPQGFLPPSAPKFHLWLMSFFLNEVKREPRDLARLLYQSWERHLEKEGMAILVEPALRLQSRKILELRKALLEIDKEKQFRILLPCLGHQACGALAEPQDWCHEDVSWWRPKYFSQIDRMAGLDRKTLPFSYLVVTRSDRKMQELLPDLGGACERLQRLVSPAHKEGKEWEFFVCGAEGKRRIRYFPGKTGEAPERGDLLDADIEGGRISGPIHKIY